ncbi:NAD-dependent epimerase/dehydratase family protein [Rhodococcus koreensis]|uniref:NAD-dependent epimerase/dehydratase family protein n=1 Tax=Rhodococcus koreensis TaxID=99653 RepID=UPI00197FAEB2|nr:NAD(P)-dependent oxidoreductase [Rhodococcus koreensis]QSE86093.1 NAD(P)-dependent oxidoreductase [Rhodococcus koreensis]
MSIMVTGIGFVGGYVVRDLVDAGHGVVLYGYFGGVPGGDSHPDLDNARHILGEERWKDVIVAHGDICDRVLLEQTIADHNVTGIVHLASIVAASSESNIPRAIDVNIGGSVNVFEAALAQNVERVVWASSINVFGPRSLTRNGVIDDSSPLDPGSAYGSTKAFVENIAKRYHENRNLNVVGLRLGKVYGFGEHVKAGRGGGNTWFKNLVENPARGIGPNRVPFGDRSLGFHYIEDVARAFVTAVETRAGGGRSFVTTGDYRPIRDAFTFVHRLLPDAQMELVDGAQAAGLKAGAQTNWSLEYDASVVADTIGVKPKYSMEQGLWRTVNAYRELEGLVPVSWPSDD